MYIGSTGSAGPAPSRVGGRRQRRRRGHGRLRDPDRRHAARRRWLPRRRQRAGHPGRGAPSLQGPLRGRDRDDDAARGRQVRRRRLQGLGRSARRRRLGGQRALVAPRARDRPRRQHLPAGVCAGEEGRQGQPGRPAGEAAGSRQVEARPHRHHDHVLARSRRVRGDRVPRRDDHGTAPGDGVPARGPHHRLPRRAARPQARGRRSTTKPASSTSSATSTRARSR